MSCGSFIYYKGVSLKRELLSGEAIGVVGLVFSVEDACLYEMKHAKGAHGRGGTEGSNH